MMTFDFSGRVAIVTGAGRGIGRDIARAFVRAGARVVAVDRDADGVHETCAGLGDVALPLVPDIATLAGARESVSQTLARFETLDVCVNNAAVAPHTALLDERVEVWDAVYAVNCRGTFLMTQAAARAMIDRRKGGRII